VLLAAVLGLPFLMDGSPVLAQSLLGGTVNIPPPPAMSGACHGADASVQSCNEESLQAIDSARSDEGVGPMILPSNYFSLTWPEQLFVVTDLERVDRGLSPVYALTADLDQRAQAAAAGCCDPSGPAGYTWQSNWATDETTPLSVDYDWMYFDGPGSYNAACPPDCYSHRDNILGPGGEMGVGVEGSTYVQLFVQGYPDTVVFSWAGEQPYFGEAASVATAPPVQAAPPVPAAPIASTPPSSAAADPAPAAAATVSAPSVQGSGRPVQGPVHRGPAADHRWSALTVAIAATPDGLGYWTVASDGVVRAYGNAPQLGSVGVSRLATPVVGIAATPDGQGYWVVDRGGGPIVGIAPTPDGHGYWLASSQGRVSPFGNARDLGSAPPGTAVVTIGADAESEGYWLLTSVGRLLRFA
jgi:hypothetical protein